MLLFLNLSDEWFYLIIVSLFLFIGIVVIEKILHRKTAKVKDGIHEVEKALMNSAQEQIPQDQPDEQVQDDNLADESFSLPSSEPNKHQWLRRGKKDNFRMGK